MKLQEYLDGMRAASTADELEVAIQANRKAKPPFEHRFSGPTWTKICKVREERGRAICDASHLGKFVPRFDPGRRLVVCGETYRVGRGQNSTGIRYCWHYAEQFAMEVLTRNGLSKNAAHSVWGCWRDYPHRCLKTIEAALAGKMPDPPMNRLIYRGRCEFGPVKMNRKTEAKDRAHRDCMCGGWLWDCGCGWTGWTNFINWRCDRCPRTYSEYVDNDRMTAIRSAA